MDSLKELQSQLDHTKAISDFRAAIHAAVRQLWLGETLSFGFIDQMGLAIDLYLREAWAKGAATCGIKEDELSSQEILTRDNLINSQFVHLLNFADDIEENNKLAGGLLASHFSRAEMWVRRYEEARNQAKLMACQDVKYQWQVGPTEHCEDCLRMDGRIYRASIWEKYNIRPQSRSLACGGWRCQCSLVQTSEKVTPGRPPALKGP